MDSAGIVHRKTLGRGASLCDLYDVRRDQFCTVSLLRSAAPDEAITSIDVPNIFSEYTYEHTYQHKFHKLSVEAGLKISVLSGLLSLSGSGKYLNDEVNSQKVVRATLIYSITTKEDTINLHHEKLSPCVITEQFLKPEATHVVSKIRWGANVFVTFERKVDNSLQAKEIAGALQSTLTHIAVQISGKGAVIYSDKENHEMDTFSIKVQGDVVPDDRPAPQTVEDALDLMKAIPQLIKKFNHGKGIPLEVELYPLDRLADHFGTSIKEDKLKNDIDVACIGNVEAEVDNIVHQKQILHDFVAEVKDFSEHVSQEDLKECIHYQQKVNTADAEFRGSLKHAILAIRQKGDATSILHDVLRKYHENPHGAHEIPVFIDKKSALTNKMNFFQTMKDKDVDFLPKANSIDNFVAQHDNQDVYILYYSDAQRSTEKWQNTNSVFQEKIKERNEALKSTDNGVAGSLTTGTALSMSPKFVIVDVALHSHAPGANLSVHIARYSNGRLVTNDVVKDTASAVTQNIIRWTSIDKFGRPPRNITVTGFICPLALKSRCSAERRQWVCHSCNQPMKYIPGDHFYCNCGGVLLQDCQFKCCDPQHGCQYRCFRSLEDLKEQLPKITGPNSINILLLGQTGVGKTTLINALVNYLEYSTLQDATAGGVKVLIPSKFTQGTTTVQVGEADSQEACTKPDYMGQSSTQSCRSHYFTVGERQFRIIDTPGIGDVRGFQQDKQNTEHVLQYLGNVGQLHGICILLKPNESRLTPEFMFCLTSLLTNLHKHAANNIMFCYTNSRSTFYSHGDTHGLIVEMLSRIKKKHGQQIPYDETNTFYFDSESFRLLACIQHGMQFPQNVIKAYSGSWDKSVEETGRLLQAILDVEPHDVAETVSLNDARKLITLLARPLAEIANTITSNIIKISQQRETIDDAKNDEDQLQACLWRDMEVLEMTPINRPRTVCTSNSCIRTVDSATEYSSICHDPCYLENVPHDTVGHLALRQCHCMDETGKCKIGSCRCDWRQHQHILYSSRRVQVRKKDESVEKQIEDKTSAKEIVESKVKKVEQEIEELDAEKKKISSASARFAVFLKENAITPFNDSTDQYLQNMIKHRRNMGEMDQVRGLEELRKEYQHEIKLYEGSLAQSSSMSSLTSGSATPRPLRPEDVQRVLTELENLPHSGASLRQQMRASKECTAQIETYSRSSTHSSPNFTSKWNGVFSKFTVGLNRF